MTPGFLFFDLDGTIAESGRDIRAAMDEVMEDLGVAPLAEHELSVLIGPPLQEGVPHLLSARGIEHKYVQEIIARYRVVYKQSYLPYTQAISGMDEVIRALHVEKWTLAVVTSKPQPQAGIAVRATGLMECFTTVVGPREDNPISKGELLQHAMDDISARLQVHVSAANAWMIGDRHFDIHAAHAVGATSVGVLWGHGDVEEFAAAQAHHVLSRPHDLLTLLSH